MNPVLAETGIHSRSAQVDLIDFAGDRVTTRGIISRLAQTGAQLRAAFDKGAWQAWIPTPARPDQIEFVEATNPRFGLKRWRVLDREVTKGALWSTCRLQLVET